MRNFPRELEILRSDLARILYDATSSRVMYRFGDSITDIDGQRVTFASGARGRFDVIIGADGLHSNVRERVFGDEAQFVKHQGYYVCLFNLDEELSRQAPLPSDVCFNEPGRAAVVGGGSSMLYFASPPLVYDRHDLEQQKRLVELAFAESRWHVPALLAHLRRAPELYFDSISLVEMPRWWHGRTVLLGDAACGGTIGGMGSGMAIIGAYVLAGELAQGPTPEAAFERYHRKLPAYAYKCQRGAKDVRKFMAATTRWGIRLRNLAFQAFDAVPGKGFMERLLMSRATGIALAPYESAGPELQRHQ